MNRLDSGLDRLGDALRAGTTIDLAREEQHRCASDAGRARHAEAGIASPARRPRVFAASTLGLAGVGAAVMLALGGTATSSAAVTAVTRQHDGSVLVKVNTDVTGPWISPADQKLAAMGIDEQIGADYEPGPARIKGPVTCVPLSGADKPSGPKVKVLFDSDGTGMLPAGNTGVGGTSRTVHLGSCVTYKSVSLRHLGTTHPTSSTGNTGGNTGYAKDDGIN